MTDIKPKFKFKKPKGAALKKKRLRRDSDDGAQDVNAPDPIPSANQVTSEADEGEEPSALDKIREVERRRKLFSTRNRGVDALNLGKQTLRRKSTDSDDDEEEAVVGNKDLEERLKGTFDKGKLAGSNDMGGDVEGGILAKKHKKAMEEYIESNLQEQPAGSNGAASEKGDFQSTTDIEKEMYSELLVSDSGVKDVEEAKKEGDVGAGGAMMGGTGIAEVTLPVDERIKAMKDTERAAMEYEKVRKARLGIVEEEAGRDPSSALNSKRFAAVDNSDDLMAMVPMNFASGPGKRKRKDPTISEPMVQTSQPEATNTFDPTKDFSYPIYSSAIPAGSVIEKDSNTSQLGASFSHNYAQHNREWIEEKKNERQAEIDAISAQNVEDGPEESKARLGFEAARKLAKGEVLNTTGNTKSNELKNQWDGRHGSNDDRVWKTFMSNQKNRR